MRKPSLLLILLWACTLLLYGEAGSTHKLTPVNQCPPDTQGGDFRYADPEDCRFYLVCEGGTPRRRQCYPHNRTRYSEFFHTCVPTGSLADTCTRLNAKRECSRGYQALIGHQTLCHHYYNCSQSTSIYNHPSLSPYEAECPHPQLFDLVTRACVDPKLATCGYGRKKPRDLCDYATSNCSKLHRQKPCRDLPDGLHPYPGQEWSRIYIACSQGRLTRTLTCGTHLPTGTQTYFSPHKNACVSAWEVPRTYSHGLAPSCAGKPLGVYVTAERSDVYHSCPAGHVFFCGKGLAFNPATYLCDTRF